MVETQNGNLMLTQEEFNGAILYHERREKIYQLALIVTLVTAFFIGLSIN